MALSLAAAAHAARDTERAACAGDSANEATMDDAVRPVPSQPIQPIQPEPAQADLQAENGMFGVVAPLPPALPPPVARALLHSLGDALAWVVVALVLVVLLAPAVVFLAAGCWAVVMYFRSAVVIAQLLASSRLAELLDPLRVLDLAGRVAVTSAGYYALLCGLLVLEAGLLGRRWRRLFLLPGFLLTLPSALVFYFGWRLMLDVLSAEVPTSGQIVLTAYLVLDTVVLAAFLVDLRPSPRRAVRRGRRWRRAGRGHGAATATPAEMGQPAPASWPLVHFGPSSVPLLDGAQPGVRLVPVITDPDQPAVPPCPRVRSEEPPGGSPREPNPQPPSLEERGRWASRRDDGSD